MFFFFFFFGGGVCFFFLCVFVVGLFFVVCFVLCFCFFLVCFAFCFFFFCWFVFFVFCLVWYIVCFFLFGLFFLVFILGMVFLVFVGRGVVYAVFFLLALGQFGLLLFVVDRLQWAVISVFYVNCCFWVDESLAVLFVCVFLFRRSSCFFGLVGSVSHPSNPTKTQNTKQKNTTPIS